ncbi:hypothetical protein M9435_001502 [Picochlorum sp. BPE23]|nr:hypothetical protein M9435_001502 [Picochlorum sp. BPE23]
MNRIQSTNTIGYQKGRLIPSSRICGLYGRRHSIGNIAQRNGSVRPGGHVHCASSYKNTNQVSRELSTVPPGRGWKAFWSTVDAGAWLGAVASAAAFVVTQEALLIAGPLVLPLIALYASKEKNSIDAKRSQAVMERQFTSALRQLVALSEEGTAEMAEEVSAALSAFEAAKDKSGSIDENVIKEKVLPVLVKLEESVEQGDATVLKNMRRSTEAIGEGLRNLRADIRTDLQDASSEEVAALSRLDSRIAALEGAISGLDAAQSESMRRLTASLSSSLSIEEDAIASAVKAEVWRSLEPVRQLPQILSQTLPRLSADSQQQGSFDDNSLTEDGVKKILSIELENLKNSIVIEQQDMMEDLVMTVDSSQWNQLGAKLAELDEKLSRIQEDASLVKDGTESTEELVSDLKNDFQVISRDLEAIGSQIRSLPGDQQLIQKDSFFDVSKERITNQVKEKMMEKLSNILDLGDESVNLESLSAELSAVIVDYVMGEAQRGTTLVSKGSVEENIETEQRAYDELQTSTNGSGTGVPIASWLSDKEYESVPIKQEEELVLQPDPVETENGSPSSSPMAMDIDVEASSPVDHDLMDEEEEEEEEEEQQEQNQAIIEQKEDEKENVSLYDKGLAVLKRGRDEFQGGDYNAADELLAQADEYFEKAIEGDTENIKAIGNRGNALMARAKAKIMMANQKFEEGIKGAELDEDDAQDMLLKAGRLYRQILEIDPSQGKAFINWGRVICLRAEISQSAGDFEGAYSLFCNASDKFTAGVDLSSGATAAAEGLRLAGTALLGAYYCAINIGLVEDAFSLLLEAEGLLENAIAEDAQTQDLAEPKLEECRELIAQTQR